MPDHKRKQIRDAAFAAVSGGATSLGSNVFDSRAELYETSELPAGAVFVQRDETDLEALDFGGRVERTLELVWEIRAKATTDAEDQIDAAEAEIQTIMLTDSALAALVYDITHATTEIEFDFSSEKKTAMGRVAFRAKYSIDEKAPAV